MQRIKAEDAMALADNSSRYARLLDHAQGDIGFYRPVGTDPQKPHQRDEAYIVHSGTGTFVCAGERCAFAPGDVLYVPAGAEHRFEEFSADFTTWVVFFGPRPTPSAG